MIFLFLSQLLHQPFKMNELIPFDILRKTEPSFSVVKHGAYKLDKKYLKRLDELVFEQQITEEDVHYFEHVPNLRRLHFTKGVDKKETLEKIFDFPFPKLSMIIVNGWPYADIDSLKKLQQPYLLQLEIITKAEKIVFENPALRELMLFIMEGTPILDLSLCPGLASLSLNGVLPEAEVNLPQGAAELSIGSQQFPLNDQYADAIVTSFDPAIFANCVSVSSLSLYLPLHEGRAMPLPQIKKLFYNCGGAETVTLVPRIFPNVEVLTVYGTDGDQLKILFNDLKCLKNITINNANAEEEVISALQLNFPDIKIRASKYIADYMESVFMDGEWHEECNRY